MKPMLAGKVTLEDLKTWPLLASPKIDGVRGVVHNGVLLSRTLKPIPNKWVSSILSQPCFEGLDGELVVGSPCAPNCIQASTSGLMSIEGQPDFTFYIFDMVQPGLSAIQRMNEAFQICEKLAHPRVGWLRQKVVNSEAELVSYEESALALGYEGVILRHPYGTYKFGRSTIKEGLLLKLKRFSDSEAEIIGFDELMHNANEATVSELGYTKRSSHKENKVGRAMLGALIVRDLKTGLQFNIGTGFTEAQRIEIWQNRESYLGKIVKYKYFSIGVKDLPRHPVFVTFRHPIDMGGE